LYRGYTYQKTGEVIPQFGGELFAPDELLESLKIDDAILKNDLLVLSKYDFNTDVDVNILGHIFEHSLNEVDDVEAELRGETLDKTKSKRKKDGVFYTPKYITKYIVDNTLGKLCTEKKIELKLDEDIAIFDYQKADGKLNEKGKELYERLNTYKSWLLTVKVCDPACGSGAFLNQALSYFIEEHKFVDDIIAELTNTPLRLFDTDLQILENNIFGVDINDESVEIAKLSMWLRTAQPGRKLSDLSNNIKCGNSLIDDPAVAGDKAFNWGKEFPTVFEKGGFDVVIGNPPYVQLQGLGKVGEDLKKCGYQTFHKGGDLYCLFTERGYQILRYGGIQSFIMPNKWMIVSYGEPLRKFLSKTGMIQMLNFGDIQFFEGAATIVCIFVTQKIKPQERLKVLSLNQRIYNGDFFSNIQANSYYYSSNHFTEREWIIKPVDIAVKLDKMSENGVELRSLGVEINYGIKTGFNDAFYIDESVRERLISEDPKSAEVIEKMIRGRDIIPFGYSTSEYLINTHNGQKSKSITPIDVDNFPAIKNHLTHYITALEKRGDKGYTPYNLRSCAYLDAFKKPKIIYPNMTSVFPFMYDESGVYTNQKCFILTTNDENISLLALTAIFNSSLCKLWINYNCPELLGGTREISKVYFEKYPIPNVSILEKEMLEKMVIFRTNKTADFQIVTNKTNQYFSTQYNLEKLSGKLANWYELDFKDFIKELNKAIKAAKGNPLSKKDEFEWMELFEENKKKALDLKTQIDQTDKEIDRMVYELYGLTEEEIQIVENS
jgi:type I restriction-modification system DNA methylase subunit